MPDNATRFVANPVSLDISRSKFDLSHVWSGTFNAGMLVPTLAYSDVLPGDTFKVNTNIVIRSSTPMAPTMDQLYADVYYFFVPHKMVLGRESMSTATTDGIHSFEAFIGAQDSLINMPLPGNSTLPKFDLNQTVSAADFVGSFADCIGIYGINLTNYISVTPFEALAYCKVWNDYFRDPNTMNPITYSISSGKVALYGGSNNLNGVQWLNFGPGYSGGSYSIIQPACRYHGYFGSGLPWPQRNSTAVTIPLGSVAPVVFDADVTQTAGTQVYSYLPDGISAGDLGAFDLVNGSNVTQGRLVADLQNSIAASVNSVRLSFATQRWYEALARGGNRLQEMTASMFGVTPHDLTSDVPEYLGGKHFAINLTQVANTAGTTKSTTEQQAIGSTGAYSLTNDGGYIFTKSFDTWGTLVSVMVIRPHESFSQGIHRRFFRDDRLKYYWKQFANLGEQPIWEKEIYVSGNTSSDDSVFAYQEALAEYRMLPDLVTGLLRPGQSLDYWTYCNNFASAPTLAGYLNGKEIYKNVDQTLQVASTTAGFQFMAQVKHIIDAVRPMPSYSIPGLIDHH